MSLRRLAAIVALLAPLTARAGISLVIEQPQQGATDVVLRWEAEGPGPFTLLRKELTLRARAATALPLDRVADVRRTGLSGGRAVLAGETAFASGHDLHVYQLIDESDGSCSNLGYVASRQNFGPGATVFMALPRRSTIRSLGQVLDTWPAATGVTLREPERCRRASLEVLRDGTRRGVDAWIPPDRGFEMRLGNGLGIVIAGAAEWRAPQTSVKCPPTTCRLAVDELSAIPWGVQWTTADNLLCGDYSDANADGRPDTCTSGLFDGTHAASAAAPPRHGGDAFIARSVAVLLGSPRFTGNSFPLDPVGAVMLLSSGRSPATAVLATQELGASAACRCADTDGDGDDDCTERLEGTDPTDPRSHGPDADGDGVTDESDDCPFDPDPSQADGDRDGIGDACDADPTDASNPSADADGDGVLDGYDDCPDVANPAQEDREGDGFGDACDTCPTLEAPQTDSDRDGLGDACDPCPLDAVPDSDGDGLCSDDDCPDVADAGQEDADGDGFGDACDCADLPPRPEALVLRIAEVGGSALYARELTWTRARIDDRYDVASAPLSELVPGGSVASATCLASGLRDAVFGDGPRSGDVWYLVRARGACSATTWGSGTRSSPNPVATLDQGPVGACP